MIYPVIKEAFRFRFNYPAHLILHVTYLCPSRCAGCFNRANLNQGKKELELGEFDAISLGLKKLLWLHISGGEPFLRDDLDLICEMFYRRNRPEFISIPTSGVFPEKVEKMGERILRKVNVPVAIDIALDGIGEQHDLIRGLNGSFESALQTHRRIVGLKKRFRHFSTKVTTVISEKNIDNLKSICDFVRDKMKGTDFHTLIFLRESPSPSSLRLPPLDELLKNKELLLSTWLSYGYDSGLGFWERLIANAAHNLLLDRYFKMMRDKARKSDCLAGSAHAVIGADGEVFFCESLGGIGNLRDHGFDFLKLWRSPEAEKMRKDVRLCRCWCTHGCVHMDNLFLNPLMYPLIIKHVLINIALRSAGRLSRNRIAS